MELNDTEESNVHIVGCAGDAMMFYSLKPDSKPDMASMHTGCPVISGESPRFLDPAARSYHD